MWPWILRFDERKLAGFRAQAAATLGRVKVDEKAMRLARDPQQSPKPRAVMDVLWADTADVVKDAQDRGLPVSIVWPPGAFRD